MLAKLFILLVLLAILASLGSALVFLARDRDDSKRTVRALTVRIALSVALFLLLILAYLAGWIRPHGLLS